MNHLTTTIPPTTRRVQAHTDAEINAQIREATEERIALFAGAGREAIDLRLKQLDEEWDIERVLEANAASVSLLGSALGLTVSRKFFMLPAVVASFLLQHAVQGWCPPLPVFRRLGYRTASEIEWERNALKALRGDFNDLPKGDGRAKAVSDAAQK